MHTYEIRLRKDNDGVDIISDALPFGPLWCGGSNAVANAIWFAQSYSRSHPALIWVLDAAGNMIAMHEHAGEVKEW